MQYSDFNQYYRSGQNNNNIKPNNAYSKAQTNLYEHDHLTAFPDNDFYRDKTNKYTDPSFLMYQEQKFGGTNKYTSSNENAITATKGIISGVGNCETNLDPVTLLFFSPENMRRVQKMLRRAVYIKTNGKYKLEVDQAEADLLISMRAVLFDMNGARFLPFKIKRQVKELNKKTVNYILPDMISEMKQAYAYLKEINEPIKPIMRPLNVNNAGRRTLPSITTVWGV